MMNFKDLLKCRVAIDFHSIQRCLRDMDHKPELGLFSILVERVTVINLAWMAIF